jgi:APA family basic amino acid/polyamine antiporter
LNKALGHALIRPLHPGPLALSKVVGNVGLFTLSFGGMVGSAWIVILGQWLDKAGPLGAILGLTAGAAVMVMVALNYGELTARMPAAGGEVIYAFEVFGIMPAFFTGWILLVPFIAVIAFESIALTWMTSVLFPGFADQVVYHLLGKPVTAAQLLIGFAGTLLIAGQNFRGVRSAVGVQKALTIGFFVIAVSVMVYALFRGDAANLQPLVREGGAVSWQAGALAIFSTGLVWFAGFQALPQMMEERSDAVSARGIAVVMAMSVAVAAAFYTLVILAVSMAKPWVSLLNTPMATVAALQNLAPGGILAKVVLGAGALAVLKAWNSTFTVAVRTVFVQARAGFLTSGLASVHPTRRSPWVAVMVVAALNLVGIALGQGAIEPLLNVGAVCIAIVMIVAMVSLLVLRLRPDSPTPAYAVPGGLAGVLAGFVGIGFLGGVAIYEPLARSHGRLPIDFAILIAWLVVGAAVWLAKARGLRDLPRADLRARLLNQAI